MVVAVLVNRYYPSSRGLRRGSLQEDGSSQWASGSDASLAEQPLPSTSHRNKPFKAINCLTSLASDFDVISDWLFFYETLNNDADYRSERAAWDRPYLIPPIFMWATFFSCLAGTIMWLVLATDGRLVAPLLRRLGYDKLSIGHMLFLAVVFEDFPQVVLTFLIEDYYEEDGMSNLAVVNVTVSLYDTLIKLAEAYDERNDIVETGHWCKESLWAHHDSVTSVVAVHLPPSTKDGSDRSIQPLPSSPSTRSFRMLRRSPPKRMEASLGEASLPSLHESRPQLIRANTNMLSNNMLDEALSPIAPMELPRLRFLTTSLDATIRLWDTTASMKGHRRDKCIHVFRGHSSGVTCLALLGKAETYHWLQNTNLDDRDEEDDHNTFFLTGCKDGDIKLWNLHGACLKTYVTHGRNRGVTSIAPIKEGSTFVSGHLDGTARLWEVWSGLCLAFYNGHSQVVNCVCTMKDGTQFVTGSNDSTLKLWDTSAAMATFETSLSFSPDSFDTDTMRRISLASQKPIHEEYVCTRAFINKSSNSEVLSVACLEEATALVSGSSDGIARLWAVETGVLLRVFVGHQGPVTAVEVVDSVSILTGSQDKTVMLWDAISGACLRTYSEHTGYVSSISTTYEEHTFLTASDDRTCKIWHMTSVPKKKPGPDFDESLALGESQGSCGSIEIS